MVLHIPAHIAVQQHGAVFIDDGQPGIIPSERIREIVFLLDEVFHRDGSYRLQHILEIPAGRLHHDVGDDQIKDQKAAEQGRCHDQHIISQYPFSHVLLSCTKR